MRSPAENLLDTSPSRILLADAAESLHDELQQILAAEGYEVMWSGRGAEVLGSCSVEGLSGRWSEDARGGPEGRSMEPSSALSTPDLLILGDRLRDMTGLHLCQELRRRGVNLPILIASHNSSETDRVVGLELGADDYLVRPFSLRELVARVRALLRGRKIAATSGEEVLSFEDLMLYPTARRVVRQNQPVSLAPKEFKLLATLMAQPDRVWSRNDLLDAVWGIDYIGDVKTVDVHIRWLREKLEANPAHPRYIKTVRGFGYRLGG